MKSEIFTDMAGKMFKTIFYFLLEFGLVTSRHYLMFRWPVQIAKLRKWQEIKKKFHQKF